MYHRERPKTRRVLAFSPLVTQRSFIPLRTACAADGFAWEGGVGGVGGVSRLTNKEPRVALAVAGSEASGVSGRGEERYSETRDNQNIRFPMELAEDVVPEGGARSATLERMSAVSLAREVRGHVSSWAVSGSRQRWTPTG